MDADHRRQQLKRERIALEKEVEQKLSAFAKVDFSGKDRGGDLESGLAPHQALEREIERLLTKLQDINEGLMSLDVGISTLEQSQHENHREMLQDFRSSFRATQQRLKHLREKNELLRDCHRQVADYNASTAQRKLHEERDSLAKSTKMARETLSSAQAIRERLDQQRNVFGSITSNVQAIASKFPAINDVIGRIQRKKSRDMFVISAVVAICLFVVWLYIK